MPEKETERKLTKAEQKRLERYKEECERLVSEGYVAEDLTVSPVKANTTGILYGFILSIPFIFIFFLLSDLVSFEIGDDYGRNYVIFIIMIFVLIVVHELLHGIGWSFFTKNGFRSIEFGIILKSLNPYCTCGEPLSKKQYFVGLLMPCFVLGVITCLISFFNHNMWYLMMGVVMIISAGGDLLIAKILLGHKGGPDALYYDHPTDIGLVCFRK